MKLAVTIQARMSSERLPGKVLLPVAGKPLLAHMISRIQQIVLPKPYQISDIIVCTSTNASDDAIVKCADALGVKHWRGSEQQVLYRVLDAAKHFNVDVIVQTTGDCPLIDPLESAKVIVKFLLGNYDYVSNILTRTYPRGMETQVFARKTLEKVADLTQHPHDLEHVSYFIYQHPELFRLGVVEAPEALKRPFLRLTVDTPEDFSLIKNLLEQVKSFALGDFLAYLTKNPALISNSNIQQKIISY